MGKSFFSLKKLKHTVSAMVWLQQATFTAVNVEVWCVDNKEYKLKVEFQVTYLTNLFTNK